MPAGNRRLAQWRVTWLIEHSTSHQLLRCIDSFVLRNPPLRQAPKRCGKIRSAPLATPNRGFCHIGSADYIRFLCAPLRGLRTTSRFAKSQERKQTSFSGLRKSAEPLVAIFRRHRQQRRQLIVKHKTD